MPIKFRNKYRIASARLSTWDYASNGSYFVTICTAHREHFFGEVVNSQMQFSQIGERANKCWRAIPDHFSYFKLDEFSVMPNHLHGIIIIEKPCGNHRGGFNAVETGHALSLQPNAGESPKNPNHRRFRNQGNRASFVAHPEIYGPQFGGYDPVDLGRGVTYAGNPRFWVVSGQRLYLFGREENRTAFAADPARFVNEATSHWQAAQQTLAQ